MRYTAIMNGDGRYDIVQCASRKGIKRIIENLFVAEYDVEPFTIMEFEA